MNRRDCDSGRRQRPAHRHADSTRLVSGGNVRAARIDEGCEQLEVSAASKAEDGDPRLFREKSPPGRCKHSYSTAASRASTPTNRSLSRLDRASIEKVRDLALSAIAGDLEHIRLYLPDHFCT